MNSEQTKFNNWCIVELFGHSKVAGLCTEENIAGTNFLRVDIPETSKQGAFTKYYGAGAIYAINPVDESTARIAAGQIEVAPVMAWQGDAFIKKYQESKPSLPASTDIDESEDGEDEDDDGEDDGYITTQRSEGS